MEKKTKHMIYGGLTIVPALIASVIMRHQQSQDLQKMNNVDVATINDVNRDGIRDIVLENYTDYKQILLGREDGTYISLSKHQELQKEKMDVKYDSILSTYQK